jgi:hypothetical protein
MIDDIASANFDLRVLEKVLAVALDDVAALPCDSPLRAVALAELEAALVRIARFAASNRRAATQARLMLDRVCADHRKRG